MKAREIFYLILFVFGSQLVGGIGSIATMSSVTTWYIDLQKPFLNPPSWVFAPVWTFLYTLMGIAVFIVWRRGTYKRAVRTALKVFGLQLVLNALWSFLFFGLHSPGLALIEIVVLLSVIVWCSILFYRIYRPAGLLMLPYIAWVLFATYLNAMLWVLN